MLKNIKNTCVSIGQKLWISYDPAPGQSQCGDYGYLNCYSKDRREHTIDNLKFVHGKVVDIIWHYDAEQFSIEISRADASESNTKSRGYVVFIKDINRLFLDNLDE